MKRILLFLCFALMVNQLVAQEKFKKRRTIGVSFTLTDFKTAAELRTLGLSRVIKDHRYFKDGRQNPGLSFNYLEGMSGHIDFKGTLGGYFSDYPVPNKPLVSGRPFVLEALATINAKLLTDKYWITPYVNIGVGASKVKGYFAGFIPAGVGLQVNLFDETFLFIGSSYRIPVTDNAAYHFQHSLGIAGNISRARISTPVAKVEIPVVIELPKDRDNDGILDTEDQCPDVAGLASLKGCPDHDGDGIADINDKCPDMAGTAKYSGCPIPDTDKDAINDEEDRCPNLAGVARYNGCPVPDTDGDGVNDEEDKCISVAGPVSNSGCPVIEEAIIQRVNIAAKNIFFATGSAKLLPKSFPKLNDVVKIMQDDKTLMLDIEGHTDITGTAEKNQLLSENRAAAVKTYLVSKGVDESRLKSQGFGADKPIADNKTAAGKARNRRVEMKLRNY